MAIIVDIKSILTPLTQAATKLQTIAPTFTNLAQDLCQLDTGNIKVNPAAYPSIYSDDTIN